MIDFEEQLRRRMHEDTRAVQAESWLPEAALAGAARSRRRRRALIALPTAVAVVAVGGLVWQQPWQSPTRTNTAAGPALGPEDSSKGSMRITYQDGTTVLWPAPAHGGGWITGPSIVEKAGGPALAWEQAVRQAADLPGTSQETGYIQDGDGISFVHFNGIGAQAFWAQGPDIINVIGLDPCSEWPETTALLAYEDSQVTCRVITVEGRSVIARESVDDTTVFTVRADKTAVRLTEQPAIGEQPRSAADLARAALDLPAPDLE